MAEKISFEDLGRQYQRLQEFARDLEADGKVARIQRVEVICNNGKRITAPLAAVRLERSAPPCGQTWAGTRVRVIMRWAVGTGARGRGQQRKLGVVVGERWGVDEDSMCRAILTSPYALIQLKGIWHAVFLYHHCAMRCVCAETMCETANSALRLLERRNNVGRPWTTQALVEATRLRCAGVRGDLDDAKFLWRVVLRLFQQEDSETRLPFVTTAAWRFKRTLFAREATPVEGINRVVGALARDVHTGRHNFEVARRADVGTDLPARLPWRDAFTTATWGVLRPALLRRSVEVPGL